MKPGMDIIVMNYNNKGLIEKCLLGIHKNTICSHKLIVIDQNSTDGTKEWLQEDLAIDKVIFNKVNVGAWEGRNQGVREAEHEWQMFFDSDTEIRDANWDDKMLKCGEDSKVGLVEARVELWDGKLRFAGFAGCMIRNEVFREIGLFDHHFLIGGDNDFWARFYWDGRWQIKYCPDTDIYHYCGGTITRGCMAKQSKELDTAYRKEMMELKYTEKFRDSTLWALNKKRWNAEKEMGWR